MHEAEVLHTPQSKSQRVEEDITVPRNSRKLQLWYLESVNKNNEL